MGSTLFINVIIKKIKMIPIQVYEYESVIRNFTIFAPLKHGTRWLATTKPKNHFTINNHFKDGVHTTIDMALIDLLLVDENNPYNVSKIKLKKFKRKLKLNNVVFVYRDPYESFIKSIITGLGVINNIWKGDPDELDVVMTGNGHFSPTLWQTVWNILETLEDNSVEFVELRQLSKFIRINTLQHHNYEFEQYSFENQIPYGYNKDEIIELCKTHHPTLWNNYMIQIEKETISLNKLLEKFKWIA